MKWIYQYKCGCSDGPKRKSEMLEYCHIHGSDLMVKYPILPPEPKKRKKKSIDKSGREVRE